MFFDLCDQAANDWFGRRPPFIMVHRNGIRWSGAVGTGTRIRGALRSFSREAYSVRLYTGTQQARSAEHGGQSPPGPRPSFKTARNAVKDREPRSTLRD